MKIAIIGLGNIGGTLASHLLERGQSLILVDKGYGRAKGFVEGFGEKARAASLEDALSEADIVVPAITFLALKEFITENEAKLAGKILVDPSNPIAPDENGKFNKIIPQDQSSGQVLAALLPPSAKLVKAFGTLGVASLKSGADRKPERAVLFYASDDKAAGDSVATLISASGFDPVRAGGLDSSIRLEVFGDLHEFGKLGRLVSAREAQEAL